MSLRGRLSPPRFTSALTSARKRQITRFSTSLRPFDANTPNDRHERTSEIHQEKSDGSQKRRRAGLTVPALAIFAVAVPLGWLITTRYGQQSQNKVSLPTEFTKYKLVGKDDVSSTCAIFRLRPSAKVTLDLDDPSLERAITSVEFKQPQLQIARSYTCLPQERGQDMDELRFLIRREQKGEVSSFLHRLPLDSDIEVRGLSPEYILPENIKSVLFLAGGTGIAPAMQAADTIEGQAKVHILWASRRREDCVGGLNDTTPAKTAWGWWSRSSSTIEGADGKISHAEKGKLVRLLEETKSRSAPPSDQTSQVLVDYYVDEEGTAMKPEKVENALQALSVDGEMGRRIIFVSGPEGFINYWAGSKQWANGREVQGPLRGVLSTMDLRGWEVVKL